ncbi:unnamed protein product [Rotaria sp. Silwood2]|nr:unnamed protein product [Rotaria sp. Silwood2]CAF4585578.1 unnamed protein product [Rotaria sp. Silwood2]
MNQDLFDPLFDVIVQENDESNENEIHQDDIYYDINNVVVNNEYEDVQDDYDFENCQIDHVINDESIDVEMNMNVKVATFICSSQLDKSNANQLIKLLNHVHDQETPPPLSLVSLWNQLKVKFNYTTKKYCSHCMLELIKCTCNNTNRVLNSELIVFSITEEITRVVKNNYDLIMKYRLEKQKNKDDIVQGEIYRNQSGRSQNPLTLLLYSDGKPTVLATIVEIPKPFREDENNLILLCLWHSPRGPSANQLFSEITEELRRLVTHGIDITFDRSGTKFVREKIFPRKLFAAIF